MRVVAAAALAFLAAGCSSQVDFASSSGPRDICAEPAAPTPTSWVPAAYPHAAVTFRLPPNYQMKQWDVRVGQSRGETWRTGPFRSVHLDIHEGPTKLDSAGTILQDWQKQYVRCVVAVGGRRALVERWVGGGTVFREDGSQEPTYTLQVIWALQGREYLYFTGISEDSQGQAETLAIAHTFDFHGVPSLVWTCGLTTACSGRALRFQRKSLICSRWARRPATDAGFVRLTDDNCIESFPSIEEVRKAADSGQVQLVLNLIRPLLEQDPTNVGLLRYKAQALSRFHASVLY